ncbi:LysR family transcriptional regulator [Paludisphaera soli]|uniref:LysR family transcriptional regulator n=1 Tax=Paludisphaera soli TaxID=2712865 RepID=UPI0013EC35A7|nr:LysR family transcriptional regulator [Paludisphaera soli]
MELRQYRHVLALADHASFRGASEVLGISQLALTKSLFHIERDVGQRLFDRHGRRVSPTAFGAIVVDTARRMVECEESMLRAIARIGALEGGALSVGVGPYAADIWTGHVSGRLLERYPRLSLSIHVEPWETLPDLLKSGRIELFVASIEEIRGRKEYRVVEFPEQRGVWICRAGHPLAGRATPSRSELREYVMVSPQLPPRICRWLQADGRQSKGCRRHVNTASVTMLKAMVRQGDGVSLIHPDEVRMELDRGEFAPLEFGAQPLTFHSGLVWLADRTLSPAATAFALEMLAEVGVDASSLMRADSAGRTTKA